MYVKGDQETSGAKAVDVSAESEYSIQYKDRLNLPLALHTRGIKFVCKVQLPWCNRSNTNLCHSRRKSGVCEGPVIVYHSECWYQKRQAEKLHTVAGRRYDAHMCNSF
jgi:hypothetical protein